MSEFGCTDRRGHRARAADGIDQVVVVQRGAGGQHEAPGTGVDPLDGVDDQLDSVTEQRAVIGGRGAGVGDQLVQADSLDEDRTGIHQGDLDVRPLPQAIGGQRSGVSAADNDDVRVLGHCCLLFSWDLCPGDTAGGPGVTGVPAIVTCFTGKPRRWTVQLR